MGKHVYIREKKTLPHEPGHWDKKKQLEAVTTYLATGNYAETARLINVPLVTVKSWAYHESGWWDKLVSEIQSGEGQRTDNKMSKAIDKALETLMVRLEEGDYQYDQKTGRLVKIPLKARDLERITSGLFDKRQLIRKQPTNIKQEDINHTDRLLKLAEQFAAFTTKKIEEKEIVDEYIMEGEWVEIKQDLIGDKDNGMQGSGQEGEVTEGLRV